MVHEILKAGLPLSAVNGMVAAGDDDDVESKVSRMRSMGSVMCCVFRCRDGRQA
jgi:hypothetical protein